jgi:D-arabinose 1-dehydrogenase-like Zn-dependent alcohol dehydrogenase
MTTKRTTILADADLLDRVDRHARRAGTTKTAVIAAALEAYLAANEPTGEPAFVAVGKSGHGRLSLDARRVASRATVAGSRVGGRQTLDDGR